MKDRVPKYPGRYKLTPVAGQEGVYDLVRADEPVEVGTALNKANLLSDATAAKYGLGINATLNDVLNKQSGGVLIGEKKLLVSHKAIGVDVNNNNTGGLFYFKGAFYAIASTAASNEGSFIIRSSDGINWVRFRGASDEEYRNGVVTDKYLLILAKRKVSPNNAFILRIDADGNTQSIPDTGSLYDYITSNDYKNVLAVNRNRGKTISVCSTDYGASWTQYEGNIPIEMVTSVVYGKGKFVATNGTSVCFSTTMNGSWISVTLPSGSTYGDKLSFANNRFFLTGSGQKSLWSTDAITWNIITVSTKYSPRYLASNVVYDADSQHYFAVVGGQFIVESSDGVSFKDFHNLGMNCQYNTLITKNGLTIAFRPALTGSDYDISLIAEYTALKDMKGKTIRVADGVISDVQTARSLLAIRSTENQLTQQEITDLQLTDIEQGQTLTDLELLILEGQAHV